MSISKKHLLVSSLIIVFTVSSILFFAKSERGVGEPKHIFIFMTESTRADHLQCYGYERNTTPNICNLAEDGVLFENTYAQSSVTHVSLPSILTSKSPIHGLQNWTLSLNDNYTTFPETLSNHGFRNYYEGLLSNSNFDQGFIDGLDIIQRQKNSLNLIEDRITDLQKENILYFHFNTDEAHLPYTPRKHQKKWSEVEYNQSQLQDILGGGVNITDLLHKNNKLDRNDIIDLYDDEIHISDEIIGQFISHIKEREIYNESLIIFTSDHGELLGEYNLYGHGRGYKPYQELIEVPLIVKFPNNKWKDKKIKHPTRHVDIGPTIYDILDIKIPENILGKSLLPVIKGKELDLDIISSYSPSEQWSLIENNTKIVIEDPYLKSIENKDSPTLLYNLTLENPELDEKVINTNDSTLEEKLCSIYSNGYISKIESGKSQLEDKTRERLEKMGYAV